MISMKGRNKSEVIQDHIRQNWEDGKRVDLKRKLYV